MSSTIQTYASMVNFGRAVELLLYRDQRGAELVAKPIEFKESSEPGLDYDPTVRMSCDEAQALAEALWRIGVRPLESQQNTVELAALKAHLEDMRTISFSLLKGEF